MENLIPVINKLQDVFNTIGMEGIDLPQIVVVGSQSAGKSSVLENIVGRDFLPRGSGIVTRRPLVLQLINIPPDSKGQVQEWGEFLHCPNEMFYDFSKIKAEIERETERLVGRNKAVSPVPINLKIYSPKVLNLTLVDLPGITRVPVGDQPTDIELQIRKMVLQYIEKPNALILAVSAANTDLTNSDALQLAQQVDPEGQRTIGVITKIDLMDRGTNALDILMGKVVPLKLGFIGVVNRSQQDIISDKSIQEALKDEAKFFATHPVYKSIAHKCGTPYLAKTLNRLLIQHIRNTLPDLKLRINKMLLDAQQELASFGDPLYANSPGALLLQILTKFSTEYRHCIDGKLTEKLSANELYGGARINYIFFEVFGQCLAKMNPLDGLSMNDIRTAIKNASGPRTALFVPEVSFELLVQKQVERLLKPSLQCIDLVFDELQRIVAETETQELVRYHNLRERVIEVVNGLLQKCRKPTVEMVQNLINIELAFINTSHPDFLGSEGAIASVVENLAERKLSQRQNAAVASTTTSTSLASSSTTLATTAATASSGNSVHSTSATASNVASPATVSPAISLPTDTRSLVSSTTTASPSNMSAGPSFFNMFFGTKSNPSNATMSPASAVSSSTSAVTSTGASSQMAARKKTTAPTTAPTTGAPTAPMVTASTSTLHTHTHSYNHSHSSTASRNHYSTVAMAHDRLFDVPDSIQATGNPSDKERFETELIQTLLISYFNIVRKNIQDTVPKAIMHFLVNKSKNEIQNELVSALYKEELFEELLEENPAIASRRKAVKQMVDMLTRAHEILNEIRDFSVK
jgi:dynamin 1-like protein